MKSSRELDAVSTRGSLTQSGWTVNYYTTTPAPDQWVAVGVVLTGSKNDDSRRPQRMLVGRGGNERAAIEELSDRFSRLVDAQETRKVATPSRTVPNRRVHPKSAEQPAMPSADPLADPDIAAEQDRPQPS